MEAFDDTVVRVHGPSCAQPAPSRWLVDAFNCTDAWRTTQRDAHGEYLARIGLSANLTRPRYLWPPTRESLATREADRLADELRKRGLPMSWLQPPRPSESKTRESDDIQL